MIEELKEHLKIAEGLRLKPYYCTENKLTLGYGRNLEDTGITEDEADFLLMNDIIKVQSSLHNKFPWYSSLPKSKQVALGSMCFQLGLSGLSKFKKMLKALEQGDYEEAANQALDSKWAIQTPNRAKVVASMIREEDGE